MFRSRDALVKGGLCSSKAGVFLAAAASFQAYRQGMPTCIPAESNFKRIRI